MQHSAERAGVLVIRAWIEQADGSVRARIMTLTELGGHETRALAASGEAILEAVRQWLSTLGGTQPLPGCGQINASRESVDGNTDPRS